VEQLRHLTTSGPLAGFPSPKNGEGTVMRKQEWNWTNRNGTKWLDPPTGMGLGVVINWCHPKNLILRFRGELEYYVKGEYYNSEEKGHHFISFTLAVSDVNNPFQRMPKHQWKNETLSDSTELSEPGEQVFL